MGKQTRIHWYNSIKVRILVMMIIISIIPLLLLGFYSMRMAKIEIKESIHKQHVLAASRVSYAVLDLINTLNTSLDTISLTNPEIFDSNDVKENENLLYGILKNTPHLEELVIVSKSGEEISKVSKRYAVAAKDFDVISREPQFDKFKQGKPFVGSPKVDVDNQIVFDLGVPVGYTNNEFIGGFIAKISLRQVMQEISSVEVLDGSYIMLIDQEGKLIGHTDYSQVLRQQDVSGSKGVKNLLESKIDAESSTRIIESKPMIYTSYTGEDVLGVYELIPTFGWGVVVEQPLVNAYSTVRYMIVRLSLVLFIICITITVLGTYVVFQIIKPVEELEKGVYSAKNGDLDYRIPTQLNDEIGFVIEAFNEMIEEIKKKRNTEKIALQAEKRAAIGVLAAGVAHEINNPMNNLGFYADDLLERLETEDINHLKDEGIFKDYLLNIREQIYRCTDITQSLLNYSREIDSQNKQVYIPDVINQVLKLVKYPINKQNIKIDLQWQDEIPYVFLDESKLQQVILNLVTNALDAMPNSGTLTIKLVCEHNLIRIEVIDTGEGILEENLEHIFDPFYTTKPVGKGTGLGLSISQVIVERMGGTIRLESNKGVGTKAIVLLSIGTEVICNESI